VCLQIAVEIKVFTFTRVGGVVVIRFAVGYCLDYNEVYRDLPHIAVINQTGIDRFRDYEHGGDSEKVRARSSSIA
jgi:hypothetical protein